MNRQSTLRRLRKRYYPLAQLMLARVREFYREPEALFWVYGFPLLMVVALGIAFRNKPPDLIVVDIQQTATNAAGVQFAATRWARRIRSRSRQATPRLADCGCEPARRRWWWCRRIRRAEPTNIVFDPTREESGLARSKVDDALQRKAKRADPLPVRSRTSRVSRAGDISIFWCPVWWA